MKTSSTKNPMNYIKQTKKSTSNRMLFSYIVIRCKNGKVQDIIYIILEFSYFEHTKVVH